MDQVRNLQPEVLDKLYDLCSNYVDYEAYAHDNIVQKVPSGWVQQAFYECSPEYLAHSPYDDDHWKNI